MSLMGAPAVLTEPGSGSAPTRVRESIGWLAEQVARPEVRLLLLGIVAEAARDERARAALRSRFREPVVAGFVRTFDLDPERVDLTFDLVVGTLLHRATMSDQVTPDDAAVVTGLAMRTLFPDAAD